MPLSGLSDCFCCHACVGIIPVPSYLFCLKCVGMLAILYSICIWSWQLPKAGLPCAHPAFTQLSCCLPVSDLVACVHYSSAICSYMLITYMTCHLQFALQPCACAVNALASWRLPHFWQHDWALWQHDYAPCNNVYDTHYWNHHTLA